jgi:hypothetical protein
LVLPSFHLNFFNWSFNVQVLKIAIAACIAGALFAGGNACAQTSQNVSSTATVVTPIAGGATAALAFGAVTKGQANTIVATAETAGAFYFSGDESDNLTLTVPASVTLNTTSGAGGSLAVTLGRSTMVVNSIGNVHAGATTADASSGSVTIPLSADAAGNGTAADGLGQVYIWIGGSVIPSATQQRGSYSGTFLVNASYSN